MIDFSGQSRKARGSKGAKPRARPAVAKGTKRKVPAKKKAAKKKTAPAKAKAKQLDSDASDEDQDAEEARDLADTEAADGVDTGGLEDSEDFAASRAKAEFIDLASIIDTKGTGLSNGNSGGLSGGYWGPVMDGGLHVLGCSLLISLNASCHT